MKGMIDECDSVKMNPINFFLIQNDVINLTSIL